MLSGATTTKNKIHIGFMQIFYVMSTILGPATIIIAIADALNAVTDNSLWCVKNY